MYSRTSEEPTFGNFDGNSFYPDQLFGFIWEGMKVDKVCFKLDADKIISSTPITLAERVLTKGSEDDQEMSFSVNKGVTHSGTLEYSTGFTVSAGMELESISPTV